MNKKYTYLIFILFISEILLTIFLSENIFNTSNLLTTSSKSIDAMILFLSFLSFLYVFNKSKLFQTHKKIINCILLVILFIFGFYLRTNFNSTFLLDNQAMLYSEAAKIAYGIKPWEYTLNFGPFFLSSYHGYFMTLLRTVVFLMFPFSITAQDTLTAIFGALTILVSYFLVKEMYSEKEAILSAILISIVPMFVVFSRFLYLEVPLTFFVLLSYLFLIKAVKKQNTRYIVFSGIFLSLALLTKIFAFLAYPVIFLYILLEKNHLNKKFIKTAILVYLFSFLIWTTWALPNIKRIINISNDPALTGISFFDFSLKTNVSSQKVDIVDEYSRTFGFYGLTLIFLGVSYILLSRKHEDIFILSMIFVFMFFFRIISTNDVPFFLYFLLPFYIISISRYIVGIYDLLKQNPIFVFLLILSVFILSQLLWRSIQIDFISWRLDQGTSDNALLSQPIPLPTLDSGMLDAVYYLRNIIKNGDKLYISKDFNNYDGFLVDKKISMVGLPPYVSLCEPYNTSWTNAQKNISCPIDVSQDQTLWINEINTIKSENSSAWFLVSDYRLYELVFGSNVFLMKVDHKSLLEQYNFTLVYSNCYPTQEILNEWCEFNFGSQACGPREEYTCNYIFKK